MAADPDTAQRVRALLASRPDVTEKRMFGGLAVMVGGHMLCAVGSDHLMMRVGREGYEEALQRPHARIMDFTGRTMRGYVTVDPPGYRTDDALRDWIDTALDVVTALPPKSAVVEQAT